MKRVLQQPHLRFKSVKCLSDRDLQETQEGIEAFFKQCQPDDRVIFLFSGYIFADTDDRLYFATPSTTPDEQGRLIKARTIPASFVQQAMNTSPAKQQVVILDGYVRQSFSSDAAIAERAIDFPAQLSHEGRVILTAAASTTHAVEPPELDVWSYTRYLAEGIETGAADANHDGVLTAAELHHYVQRKLQVAAPAMQPQIYGSEGDVKLPLLTVPLQNPLISYRKLLEESIERGDIGATGGHWQGLNLLDDIKHGLGLQPLEAKDIEAQALRPIQDYRQRLQFYQEKFSELSPKLDAVDEPSHQALKQLQQALYLTENDTAPIEVAPYMAEQQKQRELYQKNLARYEHVLLTAMQHQYPLNESDRDVLHRLQRALQLRDEDVHASEEHLATQVTRLKDAAGNGSKDLPNGRVDAVSHAAVSESGSTVVPPMQPIEVERSRPLEQPAAVENSVAPVSVEAAAINPPASTAEPSLAKETVLQQLLLKNVSYSAPEQATVLQNPITPEPPPAPPPIEEAAVAAPIPPPAGRSERRIMRSLTELNRARLIRILFFLFMALAIPLTILAVLSMMTGRSIPDLLPFKLQSQSTNSPQNAQALNAQGLSKSQAGYNREAISDFSEAIRANPNDTVAYINRGVAHQRLGQLRLAQQDFDRALEINPKSALAFSNRSHVNYLRENYDAAFNDANSAIAIDPRLAEARINLANARFKRNDVNGALQDYNAAIQLKPADTQVLAGAYNNRGNVRFSLKALTQAQQDYNQAIQLNPNYADAYFNRGVVFLAQNNPSAASTDFQNAARLYQSLGNSQMAKAAQDQATALRQGSPQSPAQSTVNSAQIR